VAAKLEDRRQRRADSRYHLFCRVPFRVLLLSLFQMESLTKA
jgi:hypothetical protein